MQRKMLDLTIETHEGDIRMFQYSEESVHRDMICIAPECVPLLKQWLDEAAEEIRQVESTHCPF